MCLHDFWGYRSFSSVSVYNGFGLRNKLRDGPLHNEKAQGCFFSPNVKRHVLGERMCEFSAEESLKEGMVCVGRYVSYLWKSL